MPSLARLLVAATAAATLVGCGVGMPSSGTIHVGRPLPAAGGLSDVDVRALPPSWNSAMSPADVVDGFLRALVSDDGDYAIARSYLTGAAARSWRPQAGVTTYEDDALRVLQTGATPNSRTLTVTGPRVGAINSRGDYGAASGALRASYAVVRQSVGWRISRLPDGVLLSALDVPRFFRTADVYYLNASGTSLVPEQVLIQNGSAGAATALTTLLVTGPSEALAAAVHTAAPAGTTLLGNVPVDSAGVADVNLSAGLRLASRATLEAFSAQLVWTLRQVSGVTAVRLLVDGTPVSVGGATRQPVDSWRQFDPAPAGRSPRLLWVSHGRLHSNSASALVARSDPGGVVAASSSADSRVVAVLQQRPHGVRLLTGALGEPLRARLTATTITPPSFDAADDAFAVVTDARGRSVVDVTRGGEVHTVAADPSLVATAVTDLRIAHDGARVAAVDGGGHLLVGLIEISHGQPSLRSFRRITPALSGVAGLAWAGADSILVTASGTGADRVVVDTDSDGYSVRTLTTDGIRGAPVSVAAAPGEPLVVATAGGVLWAGGDGWRRIGDGRAPAYSGA